MLEKKWTAPVPAMPFIYPSALMCRVGVVLAQTLTPNAAPSDGDASPAKKEAKEGTEAEEPERMVLLRDRPITVQQRTEYRVAVKVIFFSTVTDY